MFIKKEAFTLAEVLITLGVIGVVAAMTLPTVITNYKKKQTVTQLKKVYTILSQAFKMSELENGEFYSWDLTSTSDPKEYVNKYWKPYLNAEECDTYQECGYQKSRPWVLLGSDEVSGEDVTGTVYRHALILNDGTVLSFRIPPSFGESREAKINIDINGSKAPNRNGIDYFWLVVTNKGVEPLLETNPTCSENATGLTCLKKIMDDNWEISDDYPWK